MDSDYGQRAAAALGEILPEQNRTKIVQRLFRCSRSMAYYLLAGNHWTARRLSQASELLGDAFDAAFSKPDTAFHRSLSHQDRDARVMHVEQLLDQMDRQIRVDMAREQIEQPPVEIRGSGPVPEDGA